MAELCMSCAHKKVCMKDKNLVGDVFVLGNPMVFDNKELFKKYEERKKAGFPCDDYLSADVAPVRHGRWVKKHDNVCYWYECSECGEKPPKDQWKNQWLSSYCPNCGTLMEMEDDENGV